MSKSFEVQGLIHSIGDTTEYGQNGFTKREFVIKLTGEGENSDYPNYIVLELIKDKCAMMDSYEIGDEISAQFNLSGRLWTGNDRPEKCFISLQAWKIDSLGSAQTVNGQEPPPGDYSQSNTNFDDDIPF